jgi:hypothetical protein
MLVVQPQLKTIPLKRRGFLPPATVSYLAPAASNLAFNFLSARSHIMCRKVAGILKLSADSQIGCQLNSLKSLTQHSHV